MSLKHVPSTFPVDSEEDLRFAVTQYFVELGFEPDEFSFEDQFSIRLGHTVILENRERDAIRGRSDLLLVRNDSPIAIVETKAPSNTLTDDDAWQAISYARLLQTIAPFAIVTNGKDTRVFDTYAPELTPLDSPENSTWQKNNQNSPSIADDLRYEAARMLIGVNRDTLVDFCRSQREQNISELKGNPNEGKYYSPEFYLPRQKTISHFDQWLQSELPCFALIGESGYGKTNFMCAVAESQLEDVFVLFYAARRLRTGLLDEIRKDFIWEFHRERETPFIIGRFNEIARKHESKMIIFVDGLDEYPNNRNDLKNELIDIVSRLKGHSIKLCISCKAFDWDDFVVDDQQFFNRLAASIFPLGEDVNKRQRGEKAKAKKVGIWLEAFSEEELDEVFEKYKAVFNLKGELRDTTRAECRIPLMLRFIAEVFSEFDLELPQELSISEIFDRYWERKLGKIPSNLRNDANALVSKLAELCIETDKREIDLLLLRERITWSEASFQHLVRLNVIQLIEDTYGVQTLTFEFEKIRSYIYTVLAKQWHRKQPKDVAQMIVNLFFSSLGIEAIEFYLTSIDMGITSVLTELANKDLSEFTQLLTAANLHKVSISHIPIDKRKEALLKRFEEFALTYSTILHQHLFEIRERIEPYTKGKVGIWINSTANIYQLRGRTEKFPEPVITLTAEEVSQVCKGNAPLQFLRDLQGEGSIHIHFQGPHELEDNLPQKLAWERIEKQIAKLLENRFLDEASSPQILQERIWEILLRQVQVEYRVSIPLWQQLGFKSVADIQATKIEEIIALITPLQYREIHHLKYYLYLLSGLQLNLELPKVTDDEIFAYLNQHNADLTIELLQKLLPDILGAYFSLAQRNFPTLCKRLSLFTNSNILVEIYQDSDHGDFLRLRYILLPNNSFQPKYFIRFSPKKSVPLRRKSLKGMSELQMYSVGYGKGNFNDEVNGIKINEIDVPIYVTKFPSKTPILDQAYQLIGLELESLLRTSNNSRWFGIEYGSKSDYKKLLDHWIYNFAF